MARLVCNKCNYEIMEGARFCPNCADPVDEADVVSVPATGRERPVAIVEFGYSSSGQYERAVEYASSFPSYACEGEGKAAKHAVTIGLTDVEVVQNLWEMVGDWKTSAMTIDNKRAGKKDLVYGPLGCYQKRQRAADGVRYCHGTDGRDSLENLWGCWQLGCLQDEVFGLWDGKYCALRDDRYLVIATDKIHEDVRQKIKQFRLCPVFDVQHTEDWLARIPDQIDLLDDGRPFKEETDPARMQVELDRAYRERMEERSAAAPSSPIHVTITRTEEKSGRLWKVVLWAVLGLLALAILGNL